MVRGMAGWRGVAGMLGRRRRIMLGAVGRMREGLEGRAVGGWREAVRLTPKRFTRNTKLWTIHAQHLILDTKHETRNTHHSTLNTEQ